MPAPDPASVLSVSALAGQVKDLLESEYANVWVSGEISNLTKAASGHWYLTLKDAGAQLKCTFFRAFNLRLRFDPRNGLEVFARGQVSLYPQRGDCQFTIQEMQPKGIGAAELALRQLKEKLLAKGYFDPKRKRPLPKFPKRVALVASATGAAIRDMLELLAQRWPMTDVIVRPSRVQGDGAAEDVAASIRLLNQLHHDKQLPLDAIVIGRGGGSAEDLWAFNEEVVADAIYQSTVPVVSAVGHEIDVTVADLVADKRAETPSAAIMLLVPDRKEQIADLRELKSRFQNALADRFTYLRQRLDQIATRPALRKPLDRVRQEEQRVDDLAARMQRAMKVRLQRAGEKVAATAEQLESLSPLGTLKRGYSLTLADGQIVRNAGEVKVGDTIETRLAAGTVTSRVLKTDRG
ncbi:exodeoxyribonuclease VII large subunit [Limnoglobus roseus]|uniref:Exodeoxyribonuclease 7 large subunit n=1 Tax=Limnoglobus roseus TaxID=2598579 RepID=A0A5C1AA01_9BACT|nr:exodeoxyribonuclease VII large subunit [Limnoglobus roseus]QEL16031.1 exodeoxyribonuclease VII large subunit [Limnoglobus roseus]